MANLPEFAFSKGKVFKSGKSPPVLGSTRRDWGLNMAERNYTRQLATIISIDAVGFSRLMGIDDELAVAAFEERRDIIADSCRAFGGRTFGDAGDSIMAEFGNPIEALRAAFDFQGRVVALNASVAEDMRMPFRAGINTGDVIVRGGRLYGDDVNIAARIQEFAPHDGLAISETTWHHVKDKTASEFTDLGEFMLKNIALPVRVLIAGRGSNGSSPAALTATIPPIHGQPRPSPKGPPAIAVLPFRSDGGERDVGYMADGIAEDIIYGLSNTKWLSVIAKSSSFQFRDYALGTRVIGNALGARYIVSGTMMRNGGQIRLNTSLADTSNGRLVWSQRFERGLVDIFNLRDQIGAEIVSILDKEVDRAEQVRTFQVPWKPQNLATGTARALAHEPAHARRHRNRPGILRKGLSGRSEFERRAERTGLVVFLAGMAAFRRQ